MSNTATIKAIKATIVLDPQEVLKWNVPETGKQFEFTSTFDGHNVKVPLNAKGVRKVLATIREQGAENFNVIVNGKLRLSGKPKIEEAGIIAAPKAKKDPVAEAA